MMSRITILSLLLILSALLEEAKLNSLDTTPFTCVQCTDCTSPESVTRSTVCSDLLSANHEPHCTTTSTNDGRVYRGCGEAGTARQDGCRQSVDEKTREPEVVCSCGWSECNAPEVTIKARIKRSAKKDDDKDKIWVPATRYSTAANVTAVFFTALVLVILVGGIIVASLKCCRGSPLAVKSRQGPASAMRAPRPPPNQQAPRPQPKAYKQQVVRQQPSPYNQFPGQQPYPYYQQAPGQQPNPYYQQAPGQQLPPYNQQAPGQQPPPNNQQPPPNNQQPPPNNQQAPRYW